MLKYDRIDVFDGTDVNKVNILCEYIICHYWYFLQIYFRFQPKVFSGFCNENHNHHYYKVLLENVSCKYYKYAILW